MKKLIETTISLTNYVFMFKVRTFGRAIASTLSEKKGMLRGYAKYEQTNDK